jgi:hypothetical protein
MNFYELGFTHGRNAAIYCCLGNKAPTTPDFETAQDEADYDAGYEDGYNDIDD